MAYCKALEKLFCSTSDNCIDTGAFLTKLADILDTDDAKDSGNCFDVFVCEKTGRFRNLKEHLTFNVDTILPWLFDKCGASGWEIVRTEQGRWGAGRSKRVTWTYGLFVEMR